jgi:hypothetical protein
MVYLFTKWSYYMKAAKLSREIPPNVGTSAAGDSFCGNYAYGCVGKCDMLHIDGSSQRLHKLLTGLEMQKSSTKTGRSFRQSLTVSQCNSYI